MTFKERVAEGAKAAPLPPKLDHPCRDHCSGWRQGYEAGLAETTPEDQVRLNELYDLVWNSIDEMGSLQSAMLRIGEMMKPLVSPEKFK